MNFINKAILEEEINRQIREYATADIGDDKELNATYGAKCHALMGILNFINTLEVKKVDLEEEITSQYESNYETYLTYEEFTDIAKHFFELGIKTRSGE